MPVLELGDSQDIQVLYAGDAVIAVYADQRMMDAIDSNQSLKAVVCVPHLADAVDSWKRTWNPRFERSISLVNAASKNENDDKKFD
jgi:hypothetical protein